MAVPKNNPPFLQHSWSATPKPHTRPQQSNPVMTGSLLDAPPIPPQTKKRQFLPRKAFLDQPPPGPNVTELRKIIEEKYSREYEDA